MLVAQISDLHITRRDGPLAQLVDTDRTLGLMIEALNAMSVMPDVVLLTGDLTDNGDVAEYDALRSALTSLRAPYLLLAGNHDDTTVLRSSFPDRFPTDTADGHLSYVVDEHPVRLVGLDTTVAGAEHGEFDPERRDWLDAILSSQPDRPTLLFMHHPPFATGLRWMDLTRLRGSDDFAHLLGSHPQVRLVLAGHVHRPIQTVLGSAMVSICPSTAYQIGLHLDPSVAEVTDQPPSYQLHLWREERFVTHTAPVWSGRSVDLGTYAAALEADAAQGE